jgi:hypothetical protein
MFRHLDRSDRDKELGLTPRPWVAKSEAHFEPQLGRHRSHHQPLRRLGAALAMLSLGGALAQAPTEPRGPSAADVSGTRPKGAESQDPRSTGSICPGDSLSERLDRCQGVIRPPEDIAPDNSIRPPDTGTTPVIPPPGTPGGDPKMEPKG